MNDIFISYAREDRDLAEKLASTLETHGWSVWWDPHIRSGQVFDRVIEEALENSRCVIVLWSTNSIASDWVRAEAGMAADRGILIPAIIEAGVEPPLRFRQLQTARLDSWAGDHDPHEAQSLLTDIETHIGPPAPRAVAGPEISEMPATGDQPTPAPEQPSTTSEQAPDTQVGAMARTPSAVAVQLRVALLLSAGLISSYAASHNRGYLLRGIGTGETSPALPGILPLVSVAGALLVAILAKKIAPDRLLAITLLASGIVPFIAKAFPPSAAFALSALASGLLSTGVLVLAVAMIYSLGARRRGGRRIGWLLAVSGLGHWISSWSIAYGDVTFFAAYGLAILIAAAIWFIKWMDAESSTRHEPESPLTSIGSQRSWLLYLAVTLVAAATGAVTTAYPLHLEITGLTKSSPIYTIAIVTGIFGTVVAGEVSDRSGAKPVAIVSLIVLSLAAWPTYLIISGIGMAAYGLFLFAGAAWRAAIFIHICRQSTAGIRIWLIAWIFVCAFVGEQIMAMILAGSGLISSQYAIPLLAGAALAAVPLAKKAFRPGNG